MPSRFPTLADRVRFARTFGANKAARLFYGTPHRIETLGGYTTWRAGGVLALFAAFFGAAAAVRAFRGEEESGRYELAAAGAIDRRAAFVARAAAVGVTVAVLWVATVGGLVAGRALPLAGSAYLALAAVSSAAVYAGVGTLTSQLAPSRRGALELAGLVLGVDFLVRVVADTANLPGLHWAAPLGWIEELRPFASPRPVVLLLPAALTALLLAVSLRLERRRDLGAAVFAARDGGRAHLRLLRSPTLLALRSERISLAVWIAATGGFALVVGTISKSVASGIPADLREKLQQVGQVQIATAPGYIAFAFLFFVLAVSLFCCGQLAAIRGDEAEGRLETLFALPRDRARWFAGGVALAAGGATLIALAAGVGAWLGATAVGAHVPLRGLLEAGLNCLPAGALFLGLAALLFAAVPRFGVGAAYALVSVGFVWELFGSLLSAPSWLLGVSPFHHVGLVPAQPFRLEAALVMIAAGLLAALAGGAIFRRRDLVSA